MRRTQKEKKKQTSPSTSKECENAFAHWDFKLEIIFILDVPHNSISEHKGVS